MVRSLSGTLSSAVSSKNRRPYVSCTIEDHTNHLAINVAASNSEAYSDCCIANDGSIIRVRVQRLGQFVSTAQWQRITNPLSPSQWTTWNTFSGGSGVIFQDGGCTVAHNGGGAINAYFQRGDNQKLINWFSSDGGQTWGGPGDILTPPGNALIKGISAAGHSDVFFQYDVTGGDAVGCSFFTSSWSAIHTWGLTTASGANGLAVYWDGTKYLIAYSDGYSLKTCTCSSDGITWIPSYDIAQADSALIARVSPRVAFFDGLYNLICVESDSGAITGTVYSYPRLRQSKDFIHWSNGTIMQDVSSSYGANLVKTTPPGGSRAMYVLSAMSKIQLNNAYSQSDANNYLDASSKILEYKRVDQLDRPGTLELVLDNVNANLMTSVSDYLNSIYCPIGINNLINLNEGYYTGSPPTTAESVNTGKYHIQKIKIERRPGVNQIRLTARDLTYLLDQENRFQISYLNQVLSWMIPEICARAGIFNVSVPSTTQMSTSLGLFVLHAGQKYRAALDELCRVGWLEYFLDQTETIIFKELSGSDTSVWTYTPEIENWTIGTDDIQANHVIVIGKPPTGGILGAISAGEAYDMKHIKAVGIERVLTHSDQKLVTSGLAAQSATFLMQQEQRDQYAHSIVVPANPALQLLDAIQTNDTGTQSTGINNTSRIIKQEIVFNASKGEYQQTIGLEGL